MKNIISYSGGKDSTAMLIYLKENNIPIDEVIYADVGDWIWDCAKEHNQQVEEKLGIKITTIDVSDEIKRGFERWGFPNMIIRWCTSIKRDNIKRYLQEKYQGERESIVQYIGYTFDEQKRTNKKSYYYKTRYPLIEAGITNDDALQLCKDYGFDFGGVYEHHSHFNCWLCPLQKISELEYLYNEEPLLWDRLRKMQQCTCGTYKPSYTIFDLDKKFWTKQYDKLNEKRINAKEKYKQQHF